MCPCVASLAVPVWHCSLEIESNWFWQAASDFNASKLLRGKILSVYLASYLEIWRLWGQLKHELILTNTYDLIIPGPGLTLAADTISVSAPGLSPVMSGSICIFTDLSLGHVQCPVQAENNESIAIRIQDLSLIITSNNELVLVTTGHLFSATSTFDNRINSV